MVKCRTLANMSQKNRETNGPFACLFITTTIAAAWLGMTALHEVGHVLNAWLSGGRVISVELPPRGLGDTRVSPNPHPQFVAWGGACWASLLGLSMMFVTRRGGLWRWFGQFFAGMCLIANGVYIGVGGFFGDANGADDAHELLRSRAAAWQLVLFGLVASTAGLVFWHRLGPRLGFGLAVRQTDRKMLALLFALAGFCLLAGSLLPAE
jgi:hypothetical protein